MMILHWSSDLDYHELMGHTDRAPQRRHRPDPAPWPYRVCWATPTGLVSMRQRTRAEAEAFVRECVPAGAVSRIVGPEDAPADAAASALQPGDRVQTPAGPGVIVYRRMAPPDFRGAAAYSVRLDARRAVPGYHGTVFPADAVTTLTKG